MSGPITPTLYVSSDAKDTDFTVKVLDVYPDGRAYNLDESIQRMRYRDGYDKPLAWMEPGKVYKVTLQPLTTSNYFAPGHRLRIEVSSSNFPRFDRNLNTGGNNYDETQGRRRAQRGAPLEAVPVAGDGHGGEAAGADGVEGTQAPGSGRRLGSSIDAWSREPGAGRTSQRLSMRRVLLVMSWLIVCAAMLSAQPVFRGTDIFPPEEFAARRAKVLAAIGDGVAVLQGTTERGGEQPLRQNNQFFYLTGVVEPRAIVLIDGRTKKTTLFLQPANERRDDRMFGPALAPGDDAARATGIDAVLPRDEFARVRADARPDARSTRRSAPRCSAASRRAIRSIAGAQHGGGSVGRPRLARGACSGRS